MDAGSPLAIPSERCSPSVPIRSVWCKISGHAVDDEKTFELDTDIMESSRFVIEKKKNVTLSVNSETALARTTPSPHDGHTRHTSTPAQVSKSLLLAEWHTPIAFDDPLPEEN